MRRTKELDVFVWRDARRTTLWTAIGTAVCLFIAWAGGHIGPDRPIDYAKLLQAIGVVLAGWGTFFMLHGPYTYMDAQTPETWLRDLLFKATFIPGAFCALLGSIY